MIRTLGGDAEEQPEGLVIRGGQTLTGGIVHSRGDHRIVMAAAVAASICTGPVTIVDADAVNKSYPGFFDDYQLLGGKLHVL